MKVEYIRKNFSPDRLAAIQKADQIIAQYMAQGYRMTLRQLYYQFVTINWFPNSERSYKWLGSTINDGRYAGLIDWDAIEDRNRVPSSPSEWSDIVSLAESALSSYRKDRWENQGVIAELWVEKAALAGVLQPVAERWHSTLMVNRGYSSASAMYQAAGRFKARGSPTVILYLGDHDPSGEDMVTDIQKRMDIFEAPVKVEKIALTMAQVRKYNPPPNPAKMSDSRAKKYVEEHGANSWEVDALPPNVLVSLINDSFRNCVDEYEMRRVIAEEASEKSLLADALDKALQAQGGKRKVNRKYCYAASPPFATGEN